MEITVLINRKTNCLENPNYIAILMQKTHTDSHYTPINYVYFAQRWELKVKLTCKKTHAFNAKKFLIMF